MSKAKNVILLAAALALPTTSAVAEVTAERLQGTWECFGPGQTSAMTPPIVHFENANIATIEVDGFARTAVGIADVTPETNGWTKITPASGAPMFVRSFSDNGRRVSMQLRRDGVGEYRCARLPRFDNAMIPRDRTAALK